MISSVFVSGRLGKQINKNFRVLLVERPLHDQEGKAVIDEIPVRMEGFATESFMKEKEDSFVVFKGRIEKDSEVGLALVIEHRETYGPSLVRKA